jgi:hypothetical protein
MDAVTFVPSLKRSPLNFKRMTIETSAPAKIVAFGVYYVPNRQGKIFANLKCELQEAFHSQDEAINYCHHANEGQPLDELHLGYRVYPMNWIPKGVTVR